MNTLSAETTHWLFLLCGLIIGFIGGFTFYSVANRMANIRQLDKQLGARVLRADKPSKTGGV